MLPTPSQGQAPAQPLPNPAVISAPSAPMVKEEGMNIAAITVSSRVPDFWVDQPRLWFYQVEAILAPQKLSDEAKFNMVITKLTKEVIQQLTDLLQLPTSARRYDTLKERLLTIYEESETRQVQKLISEMELGEQRPSQLLRRMRDLARGKIPDDTLKILWVSHLPPPVRAIITVADSADLDVLARIADKVMETQGSPCSISEVKVTPSTPASSSMDFTAIINEIRRINKRLDSMQSNAGQTNRRGRSQSRRRSNNSSHKNNHATGNPNWQCFYHFRFKEKANKCVSPCNWKKEVN